MNITYYATGGADKVISTKAALLEKIIVGTDIGSSIIEVSDSIDDGDGNIKIVLSGSTLQGVYEVNAIFSKGIAADITNQTNVSFVWKPTL